MSYRGERFNNGMHSLETMLEGLDLAKVPCLSDRGAGVERMVARIDREEPVGDEVPRELIRLLYGVGLMLSGKGHLVETFDLICRHGSCRDESIEDLAGPPQARNPQKLRTARRRYERHRTALLATLPRNPDPIDPIDPTDA